MGLCGLTVPVCIPVLSSPELLRTAVVAVAVSKALFTGAAILATYTCPPMLCGLIVCSPSAHAVAVAVAVAPYFKAILVTTVELPRYLMATPLPLFFSRAAPRRAAHLRTHFTLLTTQALSVSVFVLLLLLTYDALQ